MQLFYEGVEIANKVHINSADLYDNAGGIADSLEISFDDTESCGAAGILKKNSRIQIIQESINSGEMYIDEFQLKKGRFIVKSCFCSSIS